MKKETKNKDTKNIIIITAISVCVMCITVLFFIIDWKRGDYGFFDVFNGSIWAFSIVPAYAVTFKWLKKRTFAEGIYIGNVASAFEGICCIFIPWLLAPVLMFLYYYNFFENGNKNKKQPIAQ
jgi:hypothetical protein